ncbi:MAG: NAD(P)-dependent oxidoreductase, partial [Armatimonadetes bacterium]|nr:NAD(P)-dependent oxidoreductase [Armatimonadota bacterium]
PYHEYDTPHPLSVYAASKLAGEVAVSRYCLRHWIVRTAWLYGVHGRSFAATMLTLAAEGKPLRVVADQTGSPTFTVDLARAVWALVAGCDYGVHHIVNGGETTWYDLACAVLSDAGYDPAQVEPIPSSAWPAAARRPAYSVLSSLRTESPALAHMRPWPEAVADFVARKQEAWSAR